MKKTILTTTIATSLLLGFAQAATVMNFGGSGITLTEINWSTSATPVADGNNTTLLGGVEGQFALPQNSGSFTSSTLWNSRSNNSSFNFAGLTVPFASYSLVGHGFNNDSTLSHLTTTASVTQGTYDVFIFYVDKTGGNDGGVSAGLSGGTLAEYFDGDQDVDFGGASGDSTWHLYAKKLGQQTGTSVSIDIGQHTQNSRNMAIGIGYALVPEPSSTALLGLGGIALLARRRR